MFGRRTVDTTKDTQFGDAWLILALILVGLALAFDSRFLLTAVLLLLAAIGIGWFWARASLTGVRYSRSFSERRAFQGETVELALELHNAKWLPLPWATVRDLFPPELPVAATQLAVNPSTNQAEFHSFWMTGPAQRVTRRLAITCSVRGFHRYGPAQVTTGDAFGFFNRTRTQDDAEYLIVYPRLYPAADLRLPTKNPFGELRVQGSLFEDPLRPAGVRPWQTGDAMRRVHWKATARSRELLARVYEPSEEQMVHIFLNVATLERHWHGYLPELQERAISVAGSLAALATEQRLAVGLAANGTLPESDRPLRLRPGRAPNQLLHILEMLAAISPFASQPIESLIQHDAAHLPWGATLVVVTAIAHDDLLAVLLDLAAGGRRVALFTLAAAPPAQWLPNIPVYHLPHLVDDVIAPTLVRPGSSSAEGR